MPEIKRNDNQEIDYSSHENYKEIMPENGTTPKEARQYVDEMFSKKDMPENPEYFPTRNECLKDDRHPITGVPFKERTIDLPDGRKIEGVFPEFQSAFDAFIPCELYGESNKEQFKKCNEQLWKAIEKSPELRSQFTPDQLEQIKEGITDGSAPDGYVWHHDAEPGKIQLVDALTHARTGHTGGNAIWGNRSE